jgi:hypothetical protein
MKKRVIMKNFLKFAGIIPVVFLFLGITSVKTYALTGPENPFSFSAAPGVQTGTVTIRWYDDRTAKQYNLFYGTNPSNYSYGVVDLPDSQNTSNTFTINYLQPGVTYYVSLVGITGTVPIVSGPVAAEATSANPMTQTVTNHLPEFGLTAQAGSTPGTVLLSWTDNESADKYDIVYGKTPGSLVYGVENVPFTHNAQNYYTIGALQPGQPYYFSLVAERNSSIVLWSDPVSADAN